MDPELNVAEISLEQGDYEQSLNLLKTLSKRYPISDKTGSKIRMLMITALLGQGKEERAIKTCRLLTKCKDKEIREQAKQLINILVNSNNYSLRAAVAIHPSTPSEILEKLSNDDSNDVIDAVAYRQLPQEWKSLDDDEKIEKLKEDENIDGNIINILSKSNNWEIRQSVAQNQSTSEDILKILLEDDDYDVQEATKNALEGRDIPYESSTEEEDDD